MLAPSRDAFKGYRFPREVISHAVSSYGRFSLSLRDVEYIFAYRGADIRNQTIHEWEQGFSPLFADVIHRNRPRPGDNAFWEASPQTLTEAGSLIISIFAAELMSVLTESAGPPQGSFKLASVQRRET